VAEVVQSVIGLAGNPQPGWAVRKITAAP
jgi:hypothetical protein